MAAHVPRGMKCAKEASLKSSQTQARDFAHDHVEKCLLKPIQLSESGRATFLCVFVSYCSTEINRPFPRQFQKSTSVHLEDRWFFIRAPAELLLLPSACVLREKGNMWRTCRVQSQQSSQLQLNQHWRDDHTWKPGNNKHDLYRWLLQACAGCECTAASDILSGV